jgi:hypothetical protein
MQGTTIQRLAIVAILVAGGPAAAQITGPIDTGTVRTERLQLNPSQPAPATPAPRRAASPPAAPTRTLDIKAFFGSFGGSGIADGEDTVYLGVTQRDLDVRIAAAGDGGFTVSWTTVLRVGGDAQNPEVRRRATSMTFRPGPRPGLFTAADNGDPLQGGMLSWARLSRSTLTIHQFSVREGGQHDIQTYARTLTGSGMDLVYTRVVDGERQRRVRGKLVKNAG